MSAISSGERVWHAMDFLTASQKSDARGGERTASALDALQAADSDVRIRSEFFADDTRAQVQTSTTHPTRTDAVRQRHEGTVMKFFRWYQFAVPLALFPMSYLLWLRRYDGDHALVWLALSMPVVFAYVVPGLGTNWLGLWEINTRFRLGRFRPHHGFVFGTATSLFGLVCVPPAAAGFSLGDCLRAALITGSVIGFWNWLYDIYAIKSGFITINTRLGAEGQPAEVVATHHAPAYFGVFGACYGVCLQLVDALSAGSHRGAYITIGLAGNVAAVVLPVLAYVLWSLVTQGESGLKAYRTNGGRPDELERREVELVPVDRLRVSHPGRAVAER